MAYATIAGLPVPVGLYTCLVPTLGYVILGGSRALSFTTTSTIAVLTATTLRGAGLPRPGPGDLATLVLLTGVVLLAARLLRLASLVENISDALLAGLKVGVGLTVMVTQAPRLFGIPAKSGSTHFFSGLASRGLPLPVVPSFHHTGAMLPGAIAIALMAFLETVSAARTIRVSGEPVVDNNQELLADGVATLAGAFFRAMPAAGGSAALPAPGGGQRNGHRGAQLAEETHLLFTVGPLTGVWLIIGLLAGADDASPPPRGPTGAG